MLENSGYDFSEEQSRALEALKAKNCYDFIAQNYYKFRKDELKDIILELLYAFERDEYTSELDDVIEELQDRWA